jgi:uncharacterized RDD family membrane protein YckC
MYTIIGGDGKEYGPVPAEQVRDWIAAGRANLDTQAKVVGTNEWKRLRDLLEFAESSPAAPPFVPVSAAAAPAAEDELAGRWTRLGARVLDGVVASVLIGPGFVMLIPWFIAHKDDDAGQGIFGHSPFASMTGENLFASMPTTAATVLCIGWVILLAIQIFLISTRGQSIGKIVAGIRIVRLNGEQAGFVHGWLLRAFVVGAITAIPFAGTIFAVTDLLFIFSPSRRCLHDLIAGTRVVKLP